MLAGFLIIEDNRLRGAMTLRKGWKIYESTLQQFPIEGNSFCNLSIISSLKFGSGLFFTLVSMIPPGFAQKAASWIGFRGDKKMGLQYLRQCHSSASLRSHFAGVIIALNNLVLNPPIHRISNAPYIEEAENIVSQGTSCYSKGSLFQVTGALCAMEQNHIDQAIIFLETAITNCNHLCDCPPIFFRVLSNCYMMRFDWEKAISVLEKLVAEPEIESSNSSKSLAQWALPWHLLKLGALYAVLGRKEDALRLFKRVSDWKSSEKWTSMLEKLAKKYLRTGGLLSVFETLMLSGHLDKLLNFSNGRDESSRNSSNSSNGNDGGSSNSSSNDNRNHDNHESDVKTIDVENNTFWQSQQQKTLASLIEKLASEDPHLPLKKIDIRELEANSKRGLWHYLSLGYYDNINENHPSVDSRCLYLLLQAAILRSTYNFGQAIPLLKEIIEMKAVLYDKLYYVLALIDLGRCHASSNPQEATKYLKEALKLTGFVWEDAIKHRARVYLNQLGVDDTEIIQVEEISMGPTKKKLNTASGEEEFESKQEGSTKQKGKEKEQIEIEDQEKVKEEAQREKRTTEKTEEIEEDMNFSESLGD